MCLLICMRNSSAQDPTRLRMHVRVQRAAGDVIHDVRAGCHALRCHLSVVGVHRHRDALQLLCLCQRPAQGASKLRPICIE